MKCQGLKTIAVKFDDTPFIIIGDVFAPIDIIFKFFNRHVFTFVFITTFMSCAHVANSSKVWGHIP